MHRSTVLSKNVIKTSESCQIPSGETFIFEESCEYFLLKFLDDLDLIGKEILRKIERDIFTSCSEDSCLIEGNLATDKGFYDVFP